MLSTPPATRTACPRSLKRVSGLGVCLMLLLLCVMASLMIGSKPIPFNDVWFSLLGQLTKADSTIILNARLPRTLVGIALGGTSALIQALTRNPLADPGVLGINAGASFAVMLSIMFFGATSIESYMSWAFIGAAITTLLAYLNRHAGRWAHQPSTADVSRCSDRRGANRHHHRPLAARSANL